MTESDTIILVGGGGFDSDSRTTGEIVKSKHETSCISFFYEMNKKMNTSYGHLFLFLSEFTFLVLKLVYRKRAIWKGVCAQMSIFERYTPLHAQAGPNFPLKILDTEPAQRPMRVDLS